MDVSLPNDVLRFLLDFLKEDHVALSRCILVNREFNWAASSVLYSQVVLCPPYVPTFDILDRISSASQPHNAAHVRALRIGGYFTSDILSSSPVQATLVAAVKAFNHLHTVEILPEMYPENLFDEVLEQLLHRHSLTTVRVNASCMLETGAPILARIHGLERLDLQCPNRLILNRLPSWLTRLNRLRELHLTSNCGSVTPGVLRTIAPLLTNVSALSFGLSYSVTDDDLFGFLAQLPCLQSAQLQHYLAQRDSQMRRLRSLTVHHSPTDDSDNIERLCAWVRRAIYGAPIERLQLCCDEFDESAFAPRCFDALVNDFVSANAVTLHMLDLGGWLISASVVSSLFDACAALAEFSAAIDKPGYLEFARRAPAMTRLHTAVLRIYDVGISVSIEDATQLMRSSALRRLTINDLKAEVCHCRDCVIHSLIRVIRRAVGCLGIAGRRCALCGPQS
ncbi:hypothetical protein GGX14DRAFT_367657 [Mycena pura]|uniref:F-box domain-containing protein n=1 Tax=Mycena pura TaxID=153505 RepID=A0AAD6Y7R2_9AGAR|nr:hypothetical protein GGX14DRAFT_367657 [Mycena pura]